MQEIIRHLDENKITANPYLQPFQPNAFFQWVPVPSDSMQNTPVAATFDSVPTTELTIQPYFPPVQEESTNPIAAQTNHLLNQPIVKAETTSHIQENQKTIPNEITMTPTNPVQNFSNHPLFPPYPMNEMQWQQYQGNPRPPLNPYPTNPYPSIAKATKQEKATVSNPFSNFMTHFKTVEGSYDFPKMMNTAGSMLNSMNQISSIAKSIGGLFLGK